MVGARVSANVRTWPRVMETPAPANGVVVVNEKCVVACGFDLTIRKSSCHECDRHEM